MNKKGEEITLADWGRVSSCEWRIEGPHGFVLRWENFGPEHQQRDDHAGPFYDSLETNPPVVKSFTVLANGGLRIELTHDYLLSLDPNQDHEDS